MPSSSNDENDSSGDQVQSKMPPVETESVANLPSLADELMLDIAELRKIEVEDRPGPNADLYQLLAYAIALDLPGGLLIYAHGEAQQAVYHVNHAGKRLAVAALDLSGTIEDLSARIDGLACQVRALHREAEAKRRDTEFDRLRGEIAAAFSDKSNKEVSDSIDEAVAKVRNRSPVV